MHVLSRRLPSTIGRPWVAGASGTRAATAAVAAAAAMGWGKGTHSGAEMGRAAEPIGPCVASGPVDMDLYMDFEAPGRCTMLDPIARPLYL
jgi:hypothetical protein